MFNATQASQGAGQYCANLVSNKIVLDASNTSPAPGNVPNGAENGGSISFTVLFDVDSCDPGTSSDDQKLDFGALGEQQCYTLLYTQLAMECKPPYLVTPLFSFSIPSMRGREGKC